MVTAGSGMRVPKPRAGIWPEALARGMRVRRMSGESGIRWASRSLVNWVGAGMHEIFEDGAELKTRLRLGLRPGKQGGSNAAPLQIWWRTDEGGGHLSGGRVVKDFRGCYGEIADSFRKVSDGFVRKERIRVTCVHSECG